MLRKLTMDPRQQIQVSYATHSPFFIEATHFPQVRRVSRDPAASEKTPRVNITHVTVEQVKDHLDGFIRRETVQRRMDELCIDKLPEALFAEAVVLVEGTTDQAIIEGYAEREDRILASDGIVVAEVGGKDTALLPHAILTLLGIPCYLVFDGDAQCGERIRRKNKTDQQVADEVAKHGKNNRAILRYFGASEEAWPGTGAYTRYAVFGDCLETELRENWPAWQRRVDELVRAGTGFLDKNAATYRHAAMTTVEKAPDVFQEILAAVRNLRSGT